MISEDELYMAYFQKENKFPAPRFQKKASCFGFLRKSFPLNNLCCTEPMAWG